MADKTNIFILTSDYRVIEHRYPTNKTNEYSVALPDGSSRVVNLLPIPENKTLWVADTGARQVRKYNEGQISLTLNDTTAYTILKLIDSNHILLCPPTSSAPFIKIDADGNEISRFTITYPWRDEAAYRSKIWHGFDTHQMSDGSLLLTFIWANKWLLLNPDGSQKATYDLASFYPENRRQGTPGFMAIAGAAIADDQSAWVLTCELNTTSCTKFVRIDLQHNKRLASSRSKVPLTLFKRLASGYYLTLGEEARQVHFTKVFPFEETEINR